MPGAGGKLPPECGAFYYNSGCQRNDSAIAPTASSAPSAAKTALISTFSRRVMELVGRSANTRRAVQPGGPSAPTT